MSLRWDSPTDRPPHPHTTSPSGLLRTVVALALGVLLLPVFWQPSASAQTPPLTFDWSMPERFGLDRNGDKLIDYVEGATDKGATGYEAQPGSWRVDLDACGNDLPAGATFAWRVLDHPDPTQPIEVQGDGAGCGDFFMDVPEEGAYRVELVVQDGDQVVGTVRREVVVQDWLIVSVGDSYGSGEGVPDVPLSTQKLEEAQTAWANVEAKLAALTTIETSLAPFKASIAAWQQTFDDWTYFCDLSAPWGDVETCAVKTAELGWYTANIPIELAKYGIKVVGEQAADALAAVDAAINAAKATWQAAWHVADAITGELEATWQDQRCHRSANAGSAQAAKAIENADPRTSVTFVHLACSGATMAYGLLGYYEGTEHPEGVTNVECDAEGKDDGWVRPAGCIRPQVEVAKELVGDREVDAAYVSIGGNDAHFADILITCIVNEKCDEESDITDLGPRAAAAHCPGFENLPFGLTLARQCHKTLHPIDIMDTALQLIDEGINGDTRGEFDKRFPGLAVGYARLDEALVGDAGLLPQQDSGRVFLSEYVDAIKDEDGKFCDFESMGFKSLPGLSAYESQMIDTKIVPALTGAIRTAAGEHDWTFVDGVYRRFTNHGYCSAENYLVRLQDTFLVEGRYHGMVHPNLNGHHAYRDAIMDKLFVSLYPTGQVDAPRRPDQAPFADVAGPWTVSEGSSITLANDGWDSDGDVVTHQWSHDAGAKVALSDVASPAPVLRGVDDVEGTLTVTATDEDGSRTDTGTIQVTNVAPELAAPTGLEAPVLLGSNATVRATFTDAGTADTHTATIEWGDGTTSPANVTTTAGTGQLAASHAYAAPGIYTVTVTLTDDDGATDVAVHEYAVVYDPAGGFATGAGWINSPAGAYTPGDPTDPDVTGQAHFGFVSKYQKGAKVPEGQTSFRFRAAELDFESTSYEWMVISGTKATYKGMGRVNGQDGYAFMLSAIDNGSSGDTLRVRIWHKATGEVLYDNQHGDVADAAATKAIGAGAISVKGPKG